MQNNLKLNSRLRMIAEKIPRCRILADVGTDHAYIPIYAVMNGLCGKSLASDLRKGPLEMAGANIRRFGLDKRIETRVGNGLEPIAAEECDVIVIAGMGGSLIRDILSVSVNKAKVAQLLLLQPNNAADVLRKWLGENGFEIVRETLAIDAGKLYGLISAKWAGKVTAEDEFSYYAGNILLGSNDPLLRKYIEKKIKELEVVISGRSRARMKKSRTPVGGNDEKAAGMSILAGMDTGKCIEIRNRLIEFLETSPVKETI